MLLIKNISIFSPEKLGKKDILISGENIIFIGENIDLPYSNFPEYNIIDGKNLYAFPGIIDLHVHFAGAGGEGGFQTRTSEMTLETIVKSGLTTCVGLLGTDGSTRSIENLLAKAYALEEGGLTTYIWTGSYQIPLMTLTSNIKSDIIFIPKIIGVGEIAVSDHRGSHPAVSELIHLASMVRNAGLISGKCGITHFHLGDGKSLLSPIKDIIESSEMSFQNLLPTHANRNIELFNDCVDYCKSGGFIDITTGIRQNNDDVVEPHIAFIELLERGCDINHITMSSDSGGSMPIFTPDGSLKSIGTSNPSSNLEVFRELVVRGIPMDVAIKPLTSSPSKILKLNNKGFIKEGYSADIMILDKDLNLHSLISKGNILLEKYSFKHKLTF